MHSVLAIHITIGELLFDFATNMAVDSGWELLTDTATLTLPSKVYIGREQVDRHLITRHIKAGQAVSVKMGYGSPSDEVFRGYVTRIKPNIPLEIIMEDEMWKLKRDTISDTMPDATLAAVMAKHFADYETDVLDVSLGNFYIKKQTRAKLLEELKRNFGLFSFFRGGRLVVGKRYDRGNAREHLFRLDYDTLEDDLEYMTAEQVKLKVTAISNNPDGSKTEVELGDPDGDGRTLNFYNLPEAELKAAAEREMSRLKYDGWRGGFTTWGDAFVAHGDIVELQSEREQSETAGRYWVDAVLTEGGVNGIRQRIQLGPRAS